MSETAPEPTQPSGQTSSSPFMRKLGPLPLWAWMGIGLAVGLAYYLWQKNKSAAAATSSTTASTGTSGTTDESLVPQFVNQTYVQSSPPAAPAVPGPPGPTGATGATGATGPAGTTTTSAPTQASQYPAPSGTTVKKLTNTTAQVNWNYITSVTPKPTSYTIAVYQLNGKLAQQFTVNAPDTATGSGQATITGLNPKYQYNVNVWANGGSKAPPHSTAKLTM
jgi:Fibronectin type III domain